MPEKKQKEVVVVMKKATPPPDNLEPIPKGGKIPDGYIASIHPRRGKVMHKKETS